MRARAVPSAKLISIASSGASAAAERTIVRNHIAYRGPVVIDARIKPWYPRELTCRDDIAEGVSRRGREARRPARGYMPSGS